MGARRNCCRGVGKPKKDPNKDNISKRPPHDEKDPPPPQVEKRDYKSYRFI